MMGDVDVTWITTKIELFSQFTVNVFNTINDAHSLWKFVDVSKRIKFVDVAKRNIWMFSKRIKFVDVSKRIKFMDVSKRINWHFH